MGVVLVVIGSVAFALLEPYHLEQYSTLALLLAAYFAPAGITSHRQHRQRKAIFVLNLVAGWTVVGWVAALVWAFTADVEPRATATGPTYRTTEPRSVPKIRMRELEDVRDAGPWQLQLPKDRVGDQKNGQIVQNDHPQE